MDIGSLQRSGDIVEGWSLNLFLEPYRPEEAPSAALMHWVKFRIDCDAQTARFMHDVGLTDNQVVFSVPIVAADGPVQNGWVLDEQYACQGITPERPIVSSVAEAVEQAQAIMTSDAWEAER